MARLGEQKGNPNPLWRSVLPEGFLIHHVRHIRRVCTVVAFQVIDDPLNSTARYPLPDVTGGADPEKAIAFCRPGFAPGI